MSFYSPQNYCVFELCPSPSILNTRGHNVSETGSVSVLRWRGRHLLCWTSSAPISQDWNRSYFENFVFSSFQKTERWTKSETPVILRVIPDRENPSESYCFQIYLYHHGVFDCKHQPFISWLALSITIPKHWNVMSTVTSNTIIFCLVTFERWDVDALWFNGSGQRCMEWVSSGSTHQRACSTYCPDLRNCHEEDDYDHPLNFRFRRILNAFYYLFRTLVILLTYYKRWLKSTQDYIC
jgi:hypothetical protein